MTDEPAVDVILFSCVPEKVTSTADDHVYKEQLAMFRDAELHIPAVLVTEQDGLSTSVTCKRYQ